VPARETDDDPARRRDIGKGIQTIVTVVDRIAALCICGPTSAGKSDCALAAADAADGEIVNADSRQIYAGMRIGTGWPSEEAMRRVPHHLYGIVSPDERYSAGRFVEDAGLAIRSIAHRGKLPILVGGTGLYIEALSGSMPMDRPPGDEIVRARVRAESRIHPHDVLFDWLTAIDGSAAKRVGGNDRYRTLRALEAALARQPRAGDPIEPRAGDPIRPSAGDIRLDIIVLSASRDEIRRRIRARVEAMLAAGLIGEALSVRASWPAAPALTGIGFAEALAFADGTLTKRELFAHVVRRTSRYASRQATWFRRMRDARVIDADNLADAVHAAAAAARETRQMA
jgi:tRNA dimethylallyltransferase